MRNSSNIILNQVISNGSTVQTSPIDISNEFGFSVQFALSGASAAGTASIQASNDNTNFVDILGSPSVFAAAGSVVMNYDGGYFRYFRAQVIASGTTTAVITFFGKGV